MAKILVLYKHPVNVEAFNSHYLGIHAPIAKTLPGLRSFELSTGDIMGPEGRADIYMVAMLTFDSVSAIESALASPAGEAAVGDLPNFAMAGVEILICETRSM
ncbi:EthD family reductase [Glaciimonas sp. GNP009]